MNFTNIAAATITAATIMDAAEFAAAVEKAQALANRYDCPAVAFIEQAQGGAGGGYSADACMPRQAADLAARWALPLTLTVYPQRRG
jgi:hypothetical protein